MIGSLLTSIALAGVGKGPAPEGWDDAPRRVAMVVGLNRYGHDDRLHDLAYAVDDAEAMGRVLSEDGYEVFSLLDVAGPEDFRETLTRATATLQRGDLFLLYFAGHAELEAGAQDHELLLLFSDGESLPVEDLASAIRALPAEQRVVFLDTCYSERTQDLLSRYRGAPPIDVPDVGRFDAWIYSAAPRQAAQEDPQLGHGVFTYYLLDALRGAADVDGDGAVEVLEAYNWVGYRTAEHTGRAQVPRIEETRVGWNDLAITRPGEGRRDAQYAVIPWYKQILPSAEMFVDGVTRGPGSLEPGAHVIEVREGDEVLLKRKVSVRGGDVIEWEAMLDQASSRVLVGVGGGVASDPRIVGSSLQAVGWWQPRSAGLSRWSLGTAVTVGAAPTTHVRTMGRLAYLWAPTDRLAIGPMVGIGALSRRAGEAWMGAPAASSGVHAEVREGPAFFGIDGQGLVIAPVGEAVSLGTSLQATIGVVF